MKMSKPIINTTHPCAKVLYNVGNNKVNKYIVIHFTGGDGVKGENYAICNQYNNAKRPASWNYCVGNSKDNYQIFQSVDPKDIAWHCGDDGVGKYKGQCTNYNSIGVEHCCYWSGGRVYFEKGTIDASVKLVRWLMQEYNIDIDHVIRHYDVTSKNCPQPFLYNDGQWEAYKKLLMEDRSKKAETIYVNNKPFTCTSITKNGVTFVPVRQLGEMLGAKIQWQGKDKPILINGVATTCDIILDDGVSYLPLRDLGVLLGYTVNYNAKTNTKSLEK